MLGGVGAAFLRGCSQSTQVTGVVQWDDLAARMGFIERVWRGLVFLPRSCTIWSVASLTLQKHKSQDVL